MKRISHIVFFAAVASTLGVILYFFIAGASSANETAKAPVKYRSLEASAQPVPAGDQEKERTLSSAIELKPDETLLDLYSVNLDYDDEDEQVLVVRKANDGRGTIWIIAADYSSSSRRWTRSWEGTTLATKVRTFQVAVYDLIGDHNYTIVCTGIDDANQQTMTVFWKAETDFGPQPLSFVKIFETAADAVMVESADRPDSYKLGQSNAESWPISVWRSDAGSANFLDQIKETWTWNFHDRAYIKTGQARIPGASIASQMAESILDGQADTFKAWLDGIWYKESTDPRSDAALFLTFQPRDGSLLFSGEGVVEIYQWETSNPTRFGLYVAARNQSVRNLRRLLDIELAASDVINVRVFQDLRIKADVSGKWNGRYRRLSAETAKAFRRTPSAASGSAMVLAGQYAADDGSLLSLDGASYSWTKAGVTERGGYGIFSLAGKDILDMRAISRGDAPSSARSSWEISLSTRVDGEGEPVELVRLAPVNIGMDGVAAAAGTPLLLEKRDD